MNFIQKKKEKTKQYLCQITIGTTCVVVEIRDQTKKNSNLLAVQNVKRSTFN